MQSKPDPTTSSSPAPCGPPWHHHTPAYNYPWKPGVDPVPTIREVNAWLKDYCAKQGLTYLDYYSAMADEKGAMKPGLAKDGVHPTGQGYAIMGPLAEAAIAAASKK
jgi:GDSL-like Lipase/Acylhydrolase family